VLEDNWTIENNMLTPTLKLKRREIDGRYAVHFENWFQRAELVFIPSQNS